MKESAMLAHQYLKANPQLIDVDFDVFDRWDIHIHVPEGATPKDGPSAGITMLTSLVSLFTQKRVKKNIAMTGEITLRGKVLPVGGIKEKILAAKRANIKEIILSIENKKDIEEIKKVYLRGIKFIYVKNMFEVINYSITNKKVPNSKFFKL
jgi:ATP-dependent Lon protease